MQEAEKGRQNWLKHGVGEVKVCRWLLQPAGRTPADQIVWRWRLEYDSQ